MTLEELPAIELQFEETTIEGCKKTYICVKGKTLDETYDKYLQIRKDMIK